MHKIVRAKECNLQFPGLPELLWTEDRDTSTLVASIGEHAGHHMHIMPDVFQRLIDTTPLTPQQLVEAKQHLERSILTFPNLKHEDDSALISYINSKLKSIPEYCDN